MKKLALVVLMSTACGGSTDLASSTDTRGASGSPEATAKAPAAKPTKPTPKAKPKTIAFAPSEPGPAYIVVSDGIVTLLPDGTATKVAGLSKYPGLLALGLDGAVYATGRSGLAPNITLFKLDGAKAIKLGTVPGVTATGLAAGKDGVVYVSTYDDVFRFDGKTTKLERPSKPEDVTQLALTPDGKVVAAGTGGASLLAGDAWTALEIPELDSYDQVWLAGDGERLVVATGDGVFELAGDKLTRILGETTARRRPALTSGILGLYQYGQKKLGQNHPVTDLYDRDGVKTTSLRYSGSTGTVFDARGRLWYVAGGTLVVESLLGDERTAYPPGTLSALVKVGDGTANDQLVVVGGGPTTLPAIGEVQMVDTVTGKIVIGATPLANAEVEICSYASFSYRTSPCGDQETRKVVTTNADGEFSFAKVPVGIYSLAFKTGDKWGISDSKISLPKPAPTKAVGTLRYN